MHEKKCAHRAHGAGADGLERALPRGRNTREGAAEAARLRANAARPAEQLAPEAHVPEAVYAPEAQPPPQEPPDREAKVELRMMRHLADGSSVEWYPVDSRCQRDVAGCNWQVDGLAMRPVIGMRMAVWVRVFRCQHGRKPFLYSDTFHAELGAVMDGDTRLHPTIPVVYYRTGDGRGKFVTFQVVMDTVLEFFRSREFNDVAERMGSRGIQLSWDDARKIVISALRVSPPTNFLLNIMGEPAQSELSLRQSYSQLAVDFTYKVAQKVFIQTQGGRRGVKAACGTLVSSKGYVVNAVPTPVGEGISQLRMLFDLECLQEDPGMDQVVAGSAEERRAGTLMANHVYVDHLRMMRKNVEDIYARLGKRVTVHQDRFHTSRKLQSKLNARHPLRAALCTEIRKVFGAVARGETRDVTGIRDSLRKILAEFTKDCDVQDVKRASVNDSALRAVFESSAPDHQRLASAVKSRDVMKYGPCIGDEAQKIWLAIINNDDELRALLSTDGECLPQGTNKNEQFHSELKRHMSSMRSMSYDTFISLMELSVATHNANVFIKDGCRGIAWAKGFTKGEILLEYAQRQKMEKQQRYLGQYYLPMLGCAGAPTTEQQLAARGFELGRVIQAPWNPFIDDRDLHIVAQRILMTNSGKAYPGVKDLAVAILGDPNDGQRWQAWGLTYIIRKMLGRVSNAMIANPQRQFQEVRDIDMPLSDDDDAVIDDDAPEEPEVNQRRGREH